MTDLIYLIQAGDRGPVKVGLVPRQALARRLTTLQQGNPQILRLRRGLHDPTLSDQLELLERIAHDNAGLHLRDNWYQPLILARIPTDVDDVTQREVAAQGLRDLLNHERPT